MNNIKRDLEAYNLINEHGNIKVINGEQKKKTINEIKKCEPLADRYTDYIDLTKIYENEKFFKPCTRFTI